MICIFKTPLVPHPFIPGKVMASRPASDCQEACHSEIDMCEHDPTVRHQKEGRFLLALELKRYFRGQPLTVEQEAAIEADPNLLLFDKVE